MGVGFQFCDEVVSLSGGFGEAESGGAFEGVTDGVFECAEVADGDEEGFYVCAGSEDGADGFVGVGLAFQKCVGAFFGGGRGEGAGEAAFGAAYGGFLEEQAQVGGEAEFAGVCDALAVD